jgi:hypothetical protein
VDHALCRASCGVAHDKEWAIFRASRLAHDKSPVAAAILGQFAVRLPHGARQIDLIILFFPVFKSKNSQKT